MKFHVDARYIAGVDPAPHMDAEIARVRELHEAGVFEQVLARPDKTGAYLVVEAEDEAAVHAHLATLPFVEHDVMTMTVEPITVIWPAQG